jgi:hypothetical protein
VSRLDFQAIIAIIILLIAVFYTIFRFRKNWQKGDTDPKCDDCEIPDMIKKKKGSEN